MKTDTPMPQQDPLLVEQLRQAIRESGLFLKELGKRTGVDHGRLSRFMRGERDITFAAAARVCAVLGLTFSRVSNDGASQAVASPTKGRGRSSRRKAV